MFDRLRQGLLDLKALRQQLNALTVEVSALRRDLNITLGENRLVSRQLLLPPEELWLGKPESKPGYPPMGVFPKSVGCRQEMFEQPYFAYWTDRLGHVLRYHRKLWEFVFICQVLFERRILQPGARGLGFGVGEEPLSALFASMGCKITATDMAPEAAVLAGWTDTQQYAAGKAALRNPLVCPDDKFEDNVSFEVCDMNAIPDTLSGYDFCWSACALEHLGSIEQGLAFIERSVQCLRPGGLAVHTTELNVSSNDDTVDNMGTVLFRRRDFEALAVRLRAQGHIVAPFDFDPGPRALDRYVDMPPYLFEPHLKLALEGFAATSFGIIVQRAP